MKGQWHGGKGASPRKRDSTKWDKGYELAFSKKEEVSIPEKKILTDFKKVLNEIKSACKRIFERVFNRQSRD